MELGFNKVRRARDLDEIAELLFPGNRAHQKLFLAMFVELKWAEDGFLPALGPVATRCGVSRRTLENVRAKTRRLGVIDHVSRFSAAQGYREGWVLSRRFARSLRELADRMDEQSERRGAMQERKERGLIHFY